MRRNLGGCYSHRNLPTTQNCCIFEKNQVALFIMEAVKQPFTNLQLELLRVFSREVPEQDLLEIRQLLAQYFAEKAMDLADAAWEAQGWTEEDEDRFLEGHERTRYKS